MPNFRFAGSSRTASPAASSCCRSDTTAQDSPQTYQNGVAHALSLHAPSSLAASSEWRHSGLDDQAGSTSMFSPATQPSIAASSAVFTPSTVNEARGYVNRSSRHSLNSPAAPDSPAYLQQPLPASGSVPPEKGHPQASAAQFQETAQPLQEFENYVTPSASRQPTQDLGIGGRSPQPLPSLAAASRASSRSITQEAVAAASRSRRTTVAPVSLDETSALLTSGNLGAWGRRQSADALLSGEQRMSAGASSGDANVQAADTSAVAAQRHTASSLPADRNAMNTANQHERHPSRSWNRNQQQTQQHMPAIDLLSPSQGSVQSAANRSGSADSTVSFDQPPWQQRPATGLLQAHTSTFERLQLEDGEQQPNGLANGGRPASGHRTAGTWLHGSRLSAQQRKQLQWQQQLAMPAAQWTSSHVTLPSIHSLSLPDQQRTSLHLSAPPPPPLLQKPGTKRKPAGCDDTIICSAAEE